MFNFLQTASDDQLALGACLMTLAGAAFFVFASYHLGPAGKRMRGNERKMPELSMFRNGSAETDRVQDRAA